MKKATILVYPSSLFPLLIPSSFILTRPGGRFEGGDVIADVRQQIRPLRVAVDQIYERAAHDRAVGERAAAPHVLRLGDAKAHANRRVGLRLDARHHLP